MAIVAGTGTLNLASHGKRLVATSMYSKGKAFVGAALLLRRTGGYEYVALHLLCQGTEIILKSLLLLADYDTYEPKLRAFGHQLIKTAEEVAACFGAAQLRAPLRHELVELTSLYSQHLLRYGSGYDILVDPRTIPSDRVLRRVGALIKLIERRNAFGERAA